MRNISHSLLRTTTTKRSESHLSQSKVEHKHNITPNVPFALSRRFSHSYFVSAFFCRSTHMNHIHIVCMNETDASRSERNVGIVFSANSKQISLHHLNLKMFERWHQKNLKKERTKTKAKCEWLCLSFLSITSIEIESETEARLADDCLCNKNKLIRNTATTMSLCVSVEAERFALKNNFMFASEI